MTPRPITAAGQQLILILWGWLPSEAPDAEYPCFMAPLLVEHEAAPAPLFEELLHSHGATRRGGPRSPYWQPADPGQARADWDAAAGPGCSIRARLTLCSPATTNFAHYHLEFGNYDGLAYLDDMDLSIALKLADGLEACLEEHRRSHEPGGGRDTAEHPHIHPIA